MSFSHPVPGTLSPRNALIAAVALALTGRPVPPPPPPRTCPLKCAPRWRAISA